MNTASQTLRNELAPAMVRRPAAAGVLLSMLERVEGGRVTLTLPDGERVSVGHGGHGYEVHLREWSVFEQVLATGDIGFAETYINGLWDTPELARVADAAGAESRRDSDRPLRPPVEPAAPPAAASAAQQHARREAGATSSPTTIWATTSTASGSTPA